MIYLTNSVKIPERYADCYGFLASSIRVRDDHEHLPSGRPWLLDNDAYAGNFDTKKWVRFLLKNDKYKAACIGVTIPDVVGDTLATLRRFSQYWRIVRDLGYPVAFVTQDGITPELAPWDYFEVLFVGGADGHKLGPEAGIMIAEAKARGKWVHVGRVNSEARIKQFWMVDSVDGTHFTFIGKGDNGEARDEAQAAEMALFSRAIRYCRNRKSGRIGVNGQHVMATIVGE